MDLTPARSLNFCPQLFLCFAGHFQSGITISMLFTSIISLGMAPIHLLTYSTLLGTELYQSFVMTKVAYQALPRSAFTSLQKRVFPIYFRSQSLLLILVAATLPPCGPISLIRKKSNWIPLVVVGSTAVLNLIVYGPRTQKLMIERIHQGILYLAICCIRLTN
jgi:hypothetical protein